MKKYVLPILVLAVTALCVGCGPKDEPDPKAAEKMVTPTGNAPADPSAIQNSSTAPGKTDTPAPEMDPGAPGNEKPAIGE